MRELTVKLLLKHLTRHFNEPVKPVSAYCESLKTWANIIRTNAKAAAPSQTFGGSYASLLPGILLDISKSNLLARLIYGNEKLRTRKCPIHDGTWCGIEECPEGCDSTGWLPEPEENSPSKEIALLDIIETHVVIVPEDFRRWLTFQGWAPRMTPHSETVALWEKRVQKEGETKEVSLALPVKNDDPMMTFFIEEAIYRYAEVSGMRPSQIALAVNG